MLSVGRSCVAQARAAALVLGLALTAAAAGREGTIEFSDGEVWTGRISLTPGKDLSIHDGPTVHHLTLEQVSELRFAPEKEELVRKWRFLEAGQTRKEESGQPYPIRHLLTTAQLAGGEAVSGHLYTTVLYVEMTNLTKKLVLLAKQRGDEGSTLQELAYPMRIAFGSAAEGLTRDVALDLSAVAAEVPLEGAEVAGLTEGALVRLPARSAGAVGQYRMPSPLGSGVILAAKKADTAYVGWPANTNADVEAAVRTALANVRDFFDQQVLCGVYREAVSGDVYSLMVLSREGATTYDAERSQPWRIEVWRWKYDEESRRLLFAGRGFFFRGIVAKGGPVPAVRLTPALGRMRTEVGRIVLDP
jgi:hypothetical protein